MVSFKETNTILVVKYAAEIVIFICSEGEKFNEWKVSNISISAFQQPLTKILLKNIIKKIL